MSESKPAPEPNKLKFNAQTISRSDVLIASFVDGYAAGWSFAVSESFRAALDICHSERVINHRHYMVWTQGSCYAFNDNDMLHNSRMAYTDWQAFLNGTNPVSLQVLKATPARSIQKETFRVAGTPPISVICESDSSIKYIDASVFEVNKSVRNKGDVDIMILRPNADRSSMEKVKAVSMTQDTLVSVLQGGIWREVNGDHVETHDFRFESDVQP